MRIPISRPQLVHVLFLSLGALSADAAEGDAILRKLSSPAVEVRRGAVDEIQTLEIPGIPAACLPLLKDEGLSIRRQAARAIGSRFTEIPAADKKAYLSALETCAAEGPEDVKLLSQRAIGLLNRNYRFPAFSVGPHGKWVLYERRRLPVIAPAKGNGPHRLLSPVITDYKGDPYLMRLAVTNYPAAYLFEPHWHPGGEALAMMPVYQSKFFHPICVWVAGEPEVKVLATETLKEFMPPDVKWATTSTFVRWAGTKVIVKIYAVDPLDAPDDPGIYLSYDIRNKKLAREHPL